MLTLRWLIALAFAGMTSWLIVAVGAVVQDEGARRIETTNATRLTELAQLLAARFDRHIRERGRLIRAVTGDEGAPSEPLGATLQRVRHLVSDVSMIGLAAPDGTMLAADPPALVGRRLEPPAQIPNGGRVIIAPPLSGASATPVITYVLPLGDTPQWGPAMLVAQLDWELMHSLDELAILDRRPEDGMQVLLIAGDDVLDASGGEIVATATDPALRRALAALDQRITDLKWEGHRHAAVRASLPDRDEAMAIALSLVVMQDTDEAMRPVEALRARIVGIGLAFVAFATAAGWLLASWIAAPLDRIAKAAGAIDGIAPKLPRSSRYAEIGTLSAALSLLLDRVTEEGARRATAFQTSLDAVVVVDESGCIEAFNTAAERIFGHSAAQAIGADMRILMPETRSSAREGYLRRLVQVGEPAIHGGGRLVLAKRRDGTTFPCRITVGESHLAGGRRVFTAFMRDMTQSREAERRLQRARAELHQMHRLVSVGQVGSQLSHEINQPLGAIANYAEAARQMIGAGKDVPRAQLDDVMTKLIAQVTRATEILRRLRRFVSKPGAARLRHDMNTLIEQSVALAVTGPAFEHVRIVYHLAPEPLAVRVDRIEIEQVLTNLIANAVEAMAETSPALLDIRSRRDGDRIVVALVDHGPGLAPAVRERLFTPFVTTKPGGLGLGLSICRTIIEAHGGSLRADPDPGGGTCFTLQLPACDDEDSL